MRKHILPSRNLSVGAALPGEAGVIIILGLLIGVCGFLWRIPSARAGPSLQIEGVQRCPGFWGLMDLLSLELQVWLSP